MKQSSEGKTPVIAGNQKTKQEFVASALRKAILTGQLREGHRLHQEEIAAQFHMSRIPVREALRALHAEGIVTFLPRKGAVVTSLSAQEIQELFEIRGALEGIAGRYAIDHISTQDMARLRELVERMGSLMDNPTEFFETNTQFHDIINRASNQKRLIEIISNLRNATEHYLRVAGLFAKIIEHAHAQHCEIIDALERKDKSGVESLIPQHVIDGARVLEEYFRRLNLP